MLLDSTVLDTGLAFRHTILEIALYWLRQLPQVTVAEATLLSATIICCPYDLLNLVSYDPTKLICLQKNDKTCHAKDAQRQQRTPRALAEC